MKKVYLFVLSFVAMLMINACSDDEGNPITNPADLVPAMTATVNGVEWKATGTPAGIDSAGFVVITGVNTSDSSNITFFFENPTETTYDFSDTASSAGAVYNGFNFASSGTITITKYTDDLMSANFNFTTDTSFFGSANTITNGRINNVGIVSK